MQFCMQSEEKMLKDYTIDELKHSYEGWKIIKALTKHGTLETL